MNDDDNNNDNNNKNKQKQKDEMRRKKMYLCLFLGKHIGNVFIFKIFIVIDICKKIQNYRFHCKQILALEITIILNVQSTMIKKNNSNDNKNKQITKERKKEKQIKLNKL